MPTLKADDARAVALTTAIQDGATPALQRALGNAFWHACRGGQRATAEYLLDRGADLHWVGYDHRTPTDAARESGDGPLLAWLRARGGASTAELR